MEPPDVYYGEYDYCTEEAAKKQKSRLSDYDLDTMLAIAMADVEKDKEDDNEYAYMLDDGYSGCDLAEDDVSVEYYGNEYGDDIDWKADQIAEDKKFEQMWPTVDAICESLTRRPREWKIGTHWIKHKPSGQIYWTGTGSYTPITESYSGSDAKKVFSAIQGEKIRDAFNARHIHNPTDEQLKAMKAFGVAPKPFKPEPGFFGRMWAAIKFFPILVKFCMGYRSQ